MLNILSKSVLMAAWYAASTHAKSMAAEPRQLTSSHVISKPPGMSCSPDLDGLAMVKTNDSDPLYYGDVDFANHIGYSEPLAFASPYHHSLTCIDARNENPAMGTPGGDTAEFISAMALHAETMGTKNLTFRQVFSKLRQFTKSLRRPFFFHTGEKYVKHALEIMKEPALPEMLPKSRLREWLDALSAAESQGCGHLRLMIQNPEKYRVPASITQNVIKAIYLLWWIDGNVIVDIYKGDLNAKGVLMVNHDSESPCKSRVPLIVPKVSEEESVFVYHLTAAQEFRRNVLIPFFGLRPRHTLKLNEMCQVQFNETAKQLASTLPIAQLNLF